MGFGLLLIGYIITYAGAFLPQISAFTYILGSGIILFSLRKLILENKLFIIAISFAFLLEISSIISLGIQLFGTTNTVSTVFAYIASGSALLLNLFLMLAIFMLAKEVDVPSVKYTSLISAILVGIGSALYILCSVITADYALERLNVLHFIFTLAYSIISAVVIFNSYVRICYEGDENMQKESSGIPFFDTLNKMFDKAFSRKNDKGKK